MKYSWNIYKKETERDWSSYVAYEPNLSVCVYKVNIFYNILEYFKFENRSKHFFVLDFML